MNCMSDQLRQSMFHVVLQFKSNGLDFCERINGMHTLTVLSISCLVIRQQRHARGT